MDAGGGGARPEKRRERDVEIDWQAAKNLAATEVINR